MLVQLTIGHVVPPHPHVHWEEVIVMVKVRQRTINVKGLWCVEPTTVDTIMKMPILRLIAVDLKVSILLFLLELDKKENAFDIVNSSELKSVSVTDVL